MGFLRMSTWEGKGCGRNRITKECAELWLRRGLCKEIQRAGGGENEGAVTAFYVSQRSGAPIGW